MVASLVHCTARASVRTAEFSELKASEILLFICKLGLAVLLRKIWSGVLNFACWPILLVRLVPHLNLGPPFQH